MRILMLSLPLIALAGAGLSAGGAADSPRPLPKPQLGGEVSVEAALQQRRSVRQYADGALELARVSQLLWAAQGVTHPDGYRTAPSAGALYPLELYLVAGEVADLPAGVYRYRPRDHDLVPVAPDDVRQPLAAAALRQAWIADAPAVLVIAGVRERTARKYGARAERYVHMEVGHAAQNVYLQAEADGLATAMVGAFDGPRLQEVLGLPADHEPLAVLPLGRPR